MEQTGTPHPYSGLLSQNGEATDRVFDQCTKATAQAIVKIILLDDCNHASADETPDGTGSLATVCASGDLPSIATVSPAVCSLAPLQHIYTHEQVSAVAKFCCLCTYAMQCKLYVQFPSDGQQI